MAHRTPADGTRRYCEEIRGYRVLSQEEEGALVARYRRDRDRAAFARLVTANLRLVVKIAREFCRREGDLADLIQEGNVGLITGVERFDPARGVRLITYAAWWIRAYILRFILNNYRLVRLGTTHAQRRIFYRLRREQSRLEARGIEPTSRRLAEILSVREEDVEGMRRCLASPDRSLDTPRGGERFAQDHPGRETHLDFLRDPAPPAEERLGRAELQHLLRETLGGFSRSLDEREKVIYERRLLAEDPLLLREIGERFGVTRERVRQIERRIREKARGYAARHLGTAVQRV